jgi:hypothetical protein
MRSNEEAVIIAALEKVNLMLADSPCPLCTRSEWQLSNRYASMMTDKGASVEDPFLDLHKILPFGMLVCQNCGNTHLIDMRVLGIFDETGRLAVELQEEGKLEEVEELADEELEEAAEEIQKEEPEEVAEPSEEDEEINKLKEAINKMNEDQAAMNKRLEELTSGKANGKKTDNTGSFFSLIKKKASGKKKKK